MRSKSNARYLAVLGTALALLFAACGTGDGIAPITTGATTTTTPETTTTIPETTTTQPPTTTTIPAPEETGLIVYFLLQELEEDAGGPFLVPVYRATDPGEDVPVAVIAELLAGPTADETAGIPSISTAIPTGTTVRSVKVSAGLATVDLSGEFDDGGGSFSMFGRLAQVVYTLTRLPDVDEVTFSLDGEPITVFSAEGIMLDGPQTRSDYTDLLPAIFVDSPAWGEPVTSPVHVTGLSNVFEATSQVMLTDDDGLSLNETTVTATCGTGCWGEWETEITYTVDRDQVGALIVWDYSARDGSRVNIREYPIQLR